jgi:hypothetical protein
VIGALVAAGATWMLLVVHTNYGLLEVYRAHLRDRTFHPTLWSMGFGRFGAVLYAASVATVVVLLVQLLRTRTDVRSQELQPLR